MSSYSTLRTSSRRANARRSQGSCGGSSRRNRGVPLCRLLGKKAELASDGLQMRGEVLLNTTRFGSGTEIQSIAAHHVLDLGQIQKGLEKSHLVSPSLQLIDAVAGAIILAFELLLGNEAG